jgi:hypothetical protein
VQQVYHSWSIWPLLWSVRAHDFTYAALPSPQWFFFTSCRMMWLPSSCPWPFSFLSILLCIIILWYHLTLINDCSCYIILKLSNMLQEAGYSTQFLLLPVRETYKCLVIKLMSHEIFFSSLIKVVSLLKHFPVFWNIKFWESLWLLLPILSLPPGRITPCGCGTFYIIVWEVKSTIDTIRPLHIYTLHTYLAVLCKVCFDLSNLPNRTCI